MSEPQTGRRVRRVVRRRPPATSEAAQPTPQPPVAPALPQGSSAFARQQPKAKVPQQGAPGMAPPAALRPGILSGGAVPPGVGMGVGGGAALGTPGVVIKLKRRLDEASLDQVVIGKRRRVGGGDDALSEMASMMQDMGRAEGERGGYRVFRRVRTAREDARGREVEIIQQQQPTQPDPKRDVKRKRDPSTAEEEEVEAGDAAAGNAAPLSLTAGGAEEEGTASVAYTKPRLVKRGRHAVIEISTESARDNAQHRTVKLEVPPGYEQVMKEAYPELMEEVQASEGPVYVVDTYIVKATRTVFASEAAAGMGGDVDMSGGDVEAGEPGIAMEQFDVDFDVEDLLEQHAAEARKATWQDDDGSEDSEDEMHPRFDYPDELDLGSADSDSQQGEAGADDEAGLESGADPLQRHCAVDGEDDLVADYAEEYDYDPTDAFLGTSDLKAFADPQMRRYAPEAFDPDKPLSDYDEEEDRFNVIGFSDEEQDVGMYGDVNPYDYD